MAAYATTVFTTANNAAEAKVISMHKVVSTVSWLHVHLLEACWF